MAAEIDFQPYLQSISTHYAQWEQYYTLTDVETKAQQKAESEPKIFPFELMVQTIAKERSPLSDDPNEKQRDREKVERFPVLEGIRKYVKEHRQVLLVGRPGSGKSTTLARLLLEEAQNSFALSPPSPPILGGTRAQNPIQDVKQTQSPPILGDLGGCKEFETNPESTTTFRGSTSLIPVLIELRFLSNSTLLDRIQAFFQRHDLQLDRTQIEDLLFHRRLLLLMDGLNELPSEAARLDVAKFRQDYPKVSMIFTTRDLGLGGDFGLEKKLEMQPLTEAQMQAFVRSYVPEQAEAMLRQLKDRLREFGQTPLLLWMLCGLFRQTGQIPTNLGEVFRAFTQGYEKNLKADVPVESDRRWWSELLQELAFWMMRGVPFGEEVPAVDVEFRVAISKVEAHQIFAAFLQNKEARAEGVAQKYLDDLLRHHLIQQNGEQVEFRHQLLQEYYAAEYLLAHWDQISEFEFKRDYLNYLKWTESIKLVIGLINNYKLALEIIKFALDLDLILGSKLAGNAKPWLHKIFVKMIGNLKVSKWLKFKLFGEINSVKIFPEVLKAITEESSSASRSALDSLKNIGLEQIIPVLLKSLENEELNVRRSAIYILSEIGLDRNINLKAFLDENLYVRGSASHSLGNVGLESAIPALFEEFIKENSPVRNTAALALGRIDSEQTTLALLEALEHKNCDVREIAASTLGRIGSEQAIPALLKALEHDKNDRVRQSVAFALGRIGSEQAIPTLLKALEHDKSDHVRENAALALGRVGSEQAIPALLKALTELSKREREYTAFTLGQIDSEKESSRLLKVLEDNSYVRGRAAYALEKIGSEKAIPALLNALEHENSDVRDKAASILGKIGSEKAIPALLNALEHENSDVRGQAAFILGEIGSEKAIPALLKALEHENSDVRGKAAYALGKIGSEKAIPALLNALEDEYFSRYVIVARALKELGSRQAIPGLIKALEHGGISSQVYAAEALGKLGSEKAIPALLNALQSRSPYVRGNAIRALRELGSKHIIPELMKALEDENFGVRRDAADALAKISSEQGVSSLIKALEDENPEVRQSAASALGRLGSTQAIPGLIKTLEDEDSEVRESAAKALSSIDNIAVVCFLPQLVALISTPSEKEAVRVIAA